MSSTDRPIPILMIALDAAEPRLIERWINDGTLPNLERLRANGAYGRLASTADWLSGSPWPTFFTGKTPAHHGLYHYKQWRSDIMRHIPPSPEWLPLRPFWRQLSEMDRRVIAIDIPMTFAPEPLEGVEIAGWATHDQLVSPLSYPPSIIDWVLREFGSPPIGHEVWGLQHVKALLKLRDHLIQTNFRVVNLAKELMIRETWDLFLVGFGATHRGGHKLWDLSNTWGHIRSVEREQFSNALRDVYISCDAAVGQLVETAGNKTGILVFSLHGMGPNTSRALLIPEMLARILNRESKQKGGPTRLLGQRFPYYTQVVSARVRDHLLPARLLAKWKPLRRARQHSSTDWSSKRAFGLLADLQGYIRINSRGREVAGIVEPGEDYDLLCSDIAEGLYTFVDTDSREPVVEKVMRSDQLFTKGNRRDRLPDLLVRWSSSPAANHKAIVSASYGSIGWPTPGRNPDGRSGNHRPEGFLVAAADGIRPNSQIENAHIRDLAPTVLALLNVNKPAEMSGDVLC